MSLTSGYMRTAHLEGLIRKKNTQTGCEGLGKYLYPTSSLKTILLSLCGWHRVADRSENTVQNFVAFLVPFDQEKLYPLSNSIMVPSIIHREEKGEELTSLKCNEMQFTLKVDDYSCKWSFILKVAC